MIELADEPKTLSAVDAFKVAQHVADEHKKGLVARLEAIEAERTEIRALLGKTRKTRMPRAEKAPKAPKAKRAKTNTEATA